MIPKIKIEKNVPFDRPTNTWVDTFKKMDKGDSFVIPKKFINNARSAAYSSGFKVAARTEGTKSVRVWLTGFKAANKKTYTKTYTGASTT